MTRTHFGSRERPRVANRKLHISVGMEDRRPEWVHIEAEEIHPGHEAWPVSASAETHRAWWLPDTGEVWAQMLPHLRKLRALSYHEQVSPDTMTPEQRRELATLRGKRIREPSSGGSGTPRLSDDDVRALRAERKAKASVPSLAAKYGVTEGYVYDLCSNRARNEVKDNK